MNYKNATIKNKAGKVETHIINGKFIDSYPYRYKHEDGYTVTTGFRWQSGNMLFRTLAEANIWAKA